jgi:hypothetical protein
MGSGESAEFPTRVKGALAMCARGLDVTVVHAMPALSAEASDVHAGGRIGLVRAALAWLPAGVAGQMTRRRSQLLLYVCGPASRSAV